MHKPLFVEREEPSLHILNFIHFGRATAGEEKRSDRMTLALNCARPR